MYVSVCLSVCVCVNRRNFFIVQSMQQEIIPGVWVNCLECFVYTKIQTFFTSLLVTMVDILQNMEDTAVIYFFKRYMSSFVDDVVGNLVLTRVCFYTYFPFFCMVFSSLTQNSLFLFKNIFCQVLKLATFIRVAFFVTQSWAFHKRFLPRLKIISHLTG